MPDQRLQGIAVALAEVLRLHGEEMIVQDVVKGLELCIGDFEKAGADEYDLVPLREVLAA